MTEPIIPEKLIAAIDRIARTMDGEYLYLYLQRRLLQVSASGDPHTLQSDNGARTFALELTNLMKKGITESGGRHTSSSTPGGEQPLVFKSAQPVAQPAPRGAGRRIDESDRSTGYDHPDDAA